MICKFCSAEIDKNAIICPSCGKNLEESAEPTAVELAEPVEKEKKKGKGTWKKVLAITGVVVLALTLTGAVLNFMGLGKTVWHTMKFWRPNDINYKLSYSVENDVAEKKKNAVIATVGSQQLTNGELQAHYWIAVYDFLEYYGNYLSYSGVDISKPLSEQIYDEETGMTYQQMFMKTALDGWYRYAVLVELSKEAGFQLSEEQQKYVDSVKTQVEELAVEYNYTDVEKFIDEQFFPGCSLELYLKYSNMNYMALSYYDSVYNSMVPTQDEIEAYYVTNAATFVTNGIDKNAGNYYDVRHILVGIDGSAQPDGTYGDDQWAACLEAAQKMLDEFLANEPTEQKFADLAMLNSRDPGSAENGGLYSGLTKDTSFIEDFKAWYLDEARQPGDTGLVKNTESSVQGYHIMYFVGSEPIWQKEAEAEILTERTNKMIAEGQAKWAIDINYKDIVISTVNLAG